MPNIKVNQILKRNGGISTPRASIYSHVDCLELKVRVEFEVKSNSEGFLDSNDNDKVRAVSIPYLGLFLTD